MSTNPQRLGKYELQERLGRGGMAEVWKALDTQLQRYVAIKFLHANLRDDPNFVTRFQREAQLIAALHHPNIVQIHDFHITQDGDSNTSSFTPTAYMAMDYIEGQTLAAYIRQTSAQGKIPSPREILSLFTSISRAVDYAHQKGMIHRDIKPANILLDAHNTTTNAMGEPILTDFGIAKLMSVSSNTVSGALLGTPLYISPEQARGYQGNERSDLYSLGVILYELVTGVTPFRGNTPMDVMNQHISATPPSPALLNPALPPAVTLVILRSLAKDPAARYPSAGAMTAALAEALNLPIPDMIDQPSYPPSSMDMPTRLESPSGHTPLPQAGPIPSPALTPQLHPSSPGIPGLTPPYAPSGPAFTPQYPPSGPVTPAFAQSGSAFTPQYPPSGSVTPAFAQSGPAFTPARPSTTVPPAGPAATPAGSATPAVPVAPPARKRRRGLWYPALLLLLILISASLGAYLLIAHPFAPPASNAAGHAFFVSSGQINPTTAQGIADEVKINLQHVPTAPAGKSYFAWLLGDIHPNTTPDLLVPLPFQPPLLLTNNLPVRNGTVDYLYPGDAHHDNLLSVCSRLLITLEDSHASTSAPSTDRSTWRYYAALPQNPIPKDPTGFSALIHIRHLFYNESNIKVLGLYGGLDTWFTRNTEQLLEWSTSARDDWNGAQTTPSQIALMHDQFIRILDYLDGAQNVHVDVPPGTPLMANSTISRVALLTVDPNAQSNANLATNPPGYVDHTQLHVGQISQATDLTPQQRELTAEIIIAIDNAKIWLMNVRKDAVQLFDMNSSQLMQPSTGALLDDMTTQITYAYIGQLDPITNTVKPGVLQMHYEIQQLATFTLTTTLPNTL
jgi:serine/threonine protein kinase